MPIITPSQLDYTDKDFVSVKSRLEKLAHSAFPTWTDFTTAAFGNFNIEMYAHVFDILGYYLDAQAGETRWSTAQLRRNVLSLVKLINPFAGDAVLVAPATHPEFVDLMRDILLARGDRALLLRGTEGEPFANPKRRPRLEFIHDGGVDALFEAEHESLRALPNLPEANDAPSTAKWIRRILDKQSPLPKPLANQLACLLYASGYAEDFNQAKAIVAVEATGLIMGGN